MAGLDRLTSDEYDRFTRLNFEYTLKFEFPFIMAVRGKTKTDIMEAMQKRVHRRLKEEWAQALSEIERITGFRLDDLIDQHGEDGRDA